MRKARWLLTLALLVLGAVSTVQSMPASEVYTEFYSDDTFSVMVGWRLRGCSSSAQWGVRSDYRMVMTSGCGNSNFFDCHYLICTYNWQTLREECVVNGYCG